jgi:hypothetical protein
MCILRSDCTGNRVLNRKCYHVIALVIRMPWDTERKYIKLLRKLDRKRDGKFTKYKIIVKVSIIFLVDLNDMIII